MKKILSYIQIVLERDRFLSEHESTSNFRGKIALQIIIAASFMILSIANVWVKSYRMLIFTLSGFISNGVFAVAALKTKKVKLCTYPAIIMCSVIFAVFVVNGGNDGFASLWIALLPIFAMTIMDFFAGVVSSAILQVFLIVVFWTPIKEQLPYRYNEQFCLRFPMFFFVTLMLGMAMTISLQKSQYDARKHLLELEKVTEIANRLAKSDPLTGLANRRCAYEIFDREFGDATIPHSIIMGDIDKFKNINDAYGHEFGDEVLVTIAKYITELLPEDYIKSRWGGEEFLMAANESIDSVYEKIEMLRLRISEHEFCCKGEIVKVTVTFGIAEYYKSSDLNDAINMADSRLYIGKRTTRNCTVKQ